MRIDHGTQYNVHGRIHTYSYTYQDTCMRGFNVVALLHWWTLSICVLASLHKCRRRCLCLVVVRRSPNCRSGASLLLSSLTHLLLCGNLVLKARCSAAPLRERLRLRGFGLVRRPLRGRLQCCLGGRTGTSSCVRGMLAAQHEVCDIGSKAKLMHGRANLMRLCDANVFSGT